MSPVDTSTTGPVGAHGQLPVIIPIAFRVGRGALRRLQSMQCALQCIQANRIRDKFNLDSMHQADHGLVFRDGQLPKTFQK